MEKGPSRFRKDPTDFRSRFQAWKRGAPAYEDGKPLSFGDRLTNTANEVAMGLGIDKGSLRRFTSDINNITRSLGLSADVQRDEYGRMYASPSVAAAPALTNAFSTYAGKYLSEVGSKATRATRQYKQRFGDLLDLDLLTNRQINAAMYGRRKEVQAIKQRHAEYDRFPNYGDRDINIMEDGTPIGHMAVSIDHGYIVPDFLSKTIDGIRSNAKGISRDAYSAGAEIARQSGFKGVKSGEHLLSPEKTTPAYRDFDTEVIANNGLRDNSGIVGNLKPYAVHNAEDAAKIAKQGKRYVWNGAPVVNLTKPKHFIPTKDLDMFDPRILDTQGNMHIDLNSKDIFRTMLPFAIGGGLWGLSNKYKNGKDLPRFKDGTRYLWDDLTNSWDRITDSDTANMMANWAFTPTTTRAKFDYENNPNYTGRISKNETIVPDNTLWTRQNVEKANNNLTWMSDVADALHLVNQVTDFLPVVGDAKLGLEAVVAAAKGDYTTAGVLGAGLLIPNALQKPYKWFKLISPVKIANFDNKLLPGISIVTGAMAGTKLGTLLTEDAKKRRELTENLKASMATGTAMLGASGAGFGYLIGNGILSINLRPKTAVGRIINDVLKRPIRTLHARVTGDYPISFNERRQFVNKYKNQILDAWEWTKRNNRLMREDFADNDLDLFYRTPDIRMNKKIDDKLYNEGADGMYYPLSARIEIHRRLKDSNLPIKYLVTGKNDLLPLTYGGVAAHEMHHGVLTDIRPYSMDVIRRNNDGNLFIGPDTNTSIGQLFDSILSKNGTGWYRRGNEFTAELQNYKHLLGVEGSMFNSSNSNVNKILNSLAARFNISTDLARLMALEYEKVIGVLK